MTVGQKQFSLRDKQAGRLPENVRVAEMPKVVKQRLANMAPKKKITSKRKTKK